RERRIRLQPVPGRAPRPDGYQFALRAERVRPAAEAVPAELRRDEYWTGSALEPAETERDVCGRRPGARVGRNDASGQPRERHRVHDRSARPRRNGRHRRTGGSAAVERIRPQVAGQPARYRGGNGWAGSRQPERLQQGAETDRRGDERLLRAGVLLEEPRRDEARS